MIVYVESNFCLELARDQEEAGAAETILRLAEGGAITLAFPVFSVCEPFCTISRYHSDRVRFALDVQRHAQDLGRSRALKHVAGTLAPLVETLRTLAKSEFDRLESTVQRLLATGHTLRLDSQVFAAALRLEHDLGLSPQDAIVLASITEDLRDRAPAEPKCFVSRNTKDFDDPTVREILSRSECRFIGGFGDALAFVRNCGAR